MSRQSSSLELPSRCSCQEVDLIQRRSNIPSHCSSFLLSFLKNLFVAHLQCTTMGPVSGGWQALTLRRKASVAVGYSGTPWSGQARNWNCRTSLFSLKPFCWDKDQDNQSLKKILTVITSIIQSVKKTFGVEVGVALVIDMSTYSSQRR